MAKNYTHLNTIAVCDDNDDILQYVSVCLTAAGHRVLSAHNYLELKELLEKAMPDLLILDVLMPETDGFTIADDLHARGFRVPIIFMTAYDNPINRRSAPLSGAVNYLKKPIDPDVLREEVAKALTGVLTPHIAESSPKIVFRASEFQSPPSLIFDHSR